ncbi:MAG: ubiquinone biosynthesis protein UbiE [Chloroflexota bacterium]
MAAPVFESLARRYDAWYETPVGAWADRLESEAILRLLALQPGERLLDLGTGTGRYAVAAAARGARVVGVDASRAMLSVARERFHASSQPIWLVRADLARLPFPDETFDAAVAVTSLCFVADPLAVLREARRVLRPGGRLVLGELNRWSLWAALRRLKGIVRPTVYRAARFHGIGELQRLLRSAGFVPGYWLGMLHLPPINHAAFLRLLNPLEQLGQRSAPWLGAFLAVVAHRGADNSQVPGAGQQAARPSRI